MALTGLSSTYAGVIVSILFIFFRGSVSDLMKKDSIENNSVGLTAEDSLLAGLQLMAVILANGIPAFDATKDAALDATFVYKSIGDTILHPKKRV